MSAPRRCCLAATLDLQLSGNTARSLPRLLTSIPGTVRRLHLGSAGPPFRFRSLVALTAVLRRLAGSLRSWQWVAAVDTQRRVPLMSLAVAIAALRELRHVDITLLGGAAAAYVMRGLSHAPRLGRMRLVLGCSVALDVGVLPPFNPRLHHLELVLLGGCLAAEWLARLPPGLRTLRVTVLGPLTRDEQAALARRLDDAGVAVVELSVATM